jgi:DNA-directed RNA polymerase sigma subunit (sigma70/sigma32)
MLEPREEYMRAKRWREHGHREAARRLVTSHLRLVAKIAMGYRGYGLPITEIISEGNVRLMQAVKRFEPENASLDTPIREGGDSGEWQDWPVDDTPSQERMFVEADEFDNRRKALDEALRVLDNRERRLIEARRLAEKPSSLEDLADEFRVSRERVRQIEVRAFEKVQNAERRHKFDSRLHARDWQ